MSYESRSHVEHFEQRIKVNYEAAQNYYAKRRVDVFMQTGMAQGKTQEELAEIKKIVKDGLRNEMDKKIEEVLTKEVSNKFTAMVNNGGEATAKMIKTKIDNKENITFDDFITLAKNFGANPNMIRNIYTTKSGGYSAQAADKMLGYIYEHISPDLLNNITAFLDKKGEQAVNSILQEMFSNLTAVGQAITTTNNPIRAEAKDGSIDIGRNVLSAPGRLHSAVEVANGLIDVLLPSANPLRNVGKKFNQNTIPIYQAQHLDKYGFQMKKGKLTNNFPYTKSRSLQKMINDYYRDGEHLEHANTGKRVFWNNKYAYYFMEAKVSDNIVSLLGPMTAGVFFGDQFLWTDHLLKMYSLVMSVTGAYTQELMEASDISKKEIIPKIEHTEVLLRQKKDESNKYDVITQLWGADSEKRNPQVRIVFNIIPPE